jgi:sigma-B regulation protein RsbU (phosphoserine phosphatase)
MKKSKLSRRITWRVIGIMSFFNVLIVGVIVAFVFVLSLGNGSMRGQYVTNGIVSNVETMLQLGKTVTFNNRSDIEANMDSPEHVFDTLEQILKINKRLAGCFIAFEPDYFKGQGRWFEAYAYYADSTHIDCRQIGSPQHDYFNGAWYQRGLSLERDDDGYLTDLYYDDTVNSGMFSSYVVPVFDRQGRKVGVYGVDLSYEVLHKTIDETMKDVRKEFLTDTRSCIASDDDIYFSIQIIDSKGTRIAGSDSLDISMLQGEQELVDSELDMKDLKGTPYYINAKQLGATGWTLVVFQHRDLVFAWGEVLAIVILFCMAIGCLVIFFFTTRSIRRATQPLGFLSDSAQEVAKGNFDASLPTFKHNDEVAQLRDSFGIMQQSLKQYMEDLKESTTAKASIERELDIAHNIQMSMLPKTFPAFPNRKDIELYAALVPAKAVGGDLYDFFIRDEKLFFCIGDVSGKGVPASLVMAVSRTLFRNIAAHTAEPNHIVETMNKNICEGNDNCMFVTLFVGVLDLQTGHLCYCNAGHDAPYIQDKLLPCDSNLPIGVTETCQYSNQETDLASGTTFFLYTDGLTEAENADRQLFGEQRITETITAFKGSPQELIETMTAAVHKFVGDYEQSDDLTMLAFRLAINSSQNSSK